MRIKSNFCGIFATAFIVTATFVIASCSQDDDYYDSDMYTLAEEMDTRSGGDPGNGESGPYYERHYCGIATIMTMLKVDLSNDYWYNKVVTTAERLGWDPSTGQGLTGEMIIRVCNELKQNNPGAHTSNLPTQKELNPIRAREILDSLKNDPNALKRVSIGLHVNTLIDG